jgi:hypothetical protein
MKGIGKFLRPNSVHDLHCFFRILSLLFILPRSKKKHIVYDSKIVQKHVILLEVACVPEHVDTQ